MVALSPAACAELGIALSDEDRARPFVEMSGRKGLGVKADDLVDRLVEKATEQIALREADEDPGARKGRGNPAAGFPEQETAGRAAQPLVDREAVARRDGLS